MKTMKKENTITGRRARAPRLQNIPIRTKTGKEIRDALSDPVLIRCDYRELELRLMLMQTKSAR